MGEGVQKNELIVSSVHEPPWEWIGLHIIKGEKKKTEKDKDERTVFE